VARKELGRPVEVIVCDTHILKAWRDGNEAKEEGSIKTLPPRFVIIFCVTFCSTLDIHPVYARQAFLCVYNQERGLLERRRNRIILRRRFEGNVLYWTRFDRFFKISFSFSDHSIITVLQSWS